MKNVTKIISSVIVSLVLIVPTTVSAQGFNDTQSEIQGKGKNLQNQVENHNPQAEINKYPHRLNVDIPTTPQTKPATLEQYDKLIPQIGEFRAYMDTEFGKSLATYQSIYDNKKADLLNKYANDVKETKNKETGAIDKYNTTLLSLHSSFAIDSNNLKQKYDNQKSTLVNQDKVDNEKAKQQAQDIYVKNNNEINAMIPVDNFKYVVLADYVNTQNQYQQQNKEINATKGNIMKQVNDFYDNLPAFTQHMNDVTNMDLKAELNKKFPGFLDSYNPNSATLRSFDDMQKDLSQFKPNTQKMVSDMYSEMGVILNSPEYKSFLDKNKSYYNDDTMKAANDFVNSQQYKDYINNAIQKSP
jgi:hypothetical protein